MGDIIDLLNAYLRNELSASTIYALALDTVSELRLPILLEECRISHVERAEVLRRHIVALGGEPSTAAGTWGILAPAVENGGKPTRQRVGIAALEEFEYQDMRRCREELAKLDDDARHFIRSRVLPAQERTFRTIKNIRYTLG